MVLGQGVAREGDKEGGVMGNAVEIWRCIAMQSVEQRHVASVPCLGVCGFAFSSYAYIEGSEERSRSDLVLDEFANLRSTM